VWRTTYLLRSANQDPAIMEMIAFMKQIELGLSSHEPI